MAVCDRWNFTGYFFATLRKGRVNNLGMFVYQDSSHKCSAAVLFYGKAAHLVLYTYHWGKVKSNTGIRCPRVLEHVGYCLFWGRLHGKFCGEESFSVIFCYSLFVCVALFSRFRGFEENVRPFISRLSFFFFFFGVEISSRSNIFHSLCQDQSTVAQRAETTVAECSLTSCVWARFRIGSHTMPGQRHSQPTPTSLGQGCMRVYV